MISHKIRLHDQMCPGLTIHYDTGMSYCSTLNFRGKSGQPSVKPLKSGLKMCKGVPRKVPKSLSGLLRPLCWLAAGDLWPSPRLHTGHLSSCSAHCTHFIHFWIKAFHHTNFDLQRLMPPGIGSGMKGEGIAQPCVKWVLSRIQGRSYLKVSM